MRKQLKRALAAVLSLAMAVTMMPADLTIAKADEVKTSSLVAKYSFASENIDGKTVKNLAVSGNDATLMGTDYTLKNGDLYLQGGAKGSTTAGWLSIPGDIFVGQDNLTINVWLKNETGSGDYAAMSFGTPTTHMGDGTADAPVNYWLLNPANPSGFFKSVWTNGDNASKPWKTETATSSTATTDEWALYSTVITPTSITGYLNGVEVQTAAKSKTTTDFGTNLCAAIGRSGYNDIFYKGYVGDVTVYAGALTIEEIISNDERALSFAKDSLTLDLPELVKKDIILPAKASFDIPITWTSSNPAVVANDGKVTRPSEDTEVTLTATIGDNLTKPFTVKVAGITPKVEFEEMLADFDMNISGVESSITLPATIGNNTTVTWTSSNPAVVGVNGTIKRPAAGQNDAKVTLTAAIKYDNGTDKYEETKSFELVVRAQAYGKILAYTRNDEDNNLGASLHLAYSVDGKSFTALNSNTGICFASNLGISGKGNNPNTITNPVLFRKADGTYGMIARSSDANAFYIYDSENMVNFTNERKLTVGQNISSSIAPQCNYNAETGNYEILYARSSTKAYKVVTPDFETILSEELTSGFEKFKLADGVTVPKGAVASGIFEASKSEYDAVVKKLDVVRNTSMESVNIKVNNVTDVAGALPKTVKAYYNDGTSKDVEVEWNVDNSKLKKDAVCEVTGTLKQTTYANPFIAQRADPCILKGNDGYYYFTASYPMIGSSDKNGYDKIVLRRATTLEGLQTAEEITIYDCDEVSTENRYIWAPEIRLVDGNYYVFYTASVDSSVWSIRPHVLKCTNPEDIMNPESWETMGRMQAISGDTRAFSGFSLDMTVFENEGRWYVIWAESAPEQYSSLWIAEIDKDEPTKCISKSAVITRPEYTWERIRENVNEGPSIIKNGDKIFCAFSAAGTGSEYCIGLLTADKNSDLLDPTSWVKQGYPVLSSADVPGEYGPGHNSFTFDENGNDIFVYHARGQECYDKSCAWANGDPLYDPCRDARIKRVHWAADGTPILKMSYSQELASTTIKAKVTIGTVVTQTPAPVVKPLPVNTVEKVDKVAYTVVNADAASPEVAFASTNKKASKVTIPATVTIKGVTYKVTGIANNAFKGNTKLKKITIPAGIKTIGKSAFNGCKNLKKITIKSTVLTKVGSSAFKKINAKATIKVPKAKKKAYTKLLKKKGQAKTVKIK